MHKQTPLAAAALLTALLITGCAPITVAENSMQSAPPTKQVGGDKTCDADAARSFIGTSVDLDDTVKIDTELRAITGAAKTRWVPDGGAVTMDYRADRLTIALDAQYRIERISCG